MTIIYYFMFCCVITVTLLALNTRRNWNVAVFVIGAILFLMAGLRAPQVDNDYGSYLLNYSLVSNISKINGIDFELLGVLEPNFFFIALFVKLIFNNVAFLFITYAFLGVFIKTLAFKKIAPQFYIVLPLLYFGHYFLLHEMTQIRAGVACGLSFLSLGSLEANKKFRFFLINIFAVLFHYSAVIFFLVFFLKGNINKYWVWIMVLLFSLVLSALPFSIFGALAAIPGLGLISEKIQTYQELAQGGYIDQIHLFNPFILLNYATIVCIFSLGRERINSVKYLPRLLKINIIGLVFFMLFKELPVMSFRIYEYFAFSQIFLIASGFTFVKEKKTALLGIILVSLFFLIVNVSVLKLVHGYHTILF